MTQPTTYEIQELDVGGILDHGIILFKDHFKGILAVLCCGLIPSNLIFFAFMVVMLPEMYAFEQGDFVPLGDLFGGILAHVVYGLLQISLIMPFTAAALTHSVASVYLGRPATVGHSVRYAFVSFPQVIPGYFLSSVAIGIGFAFCLVPGILLTLYWFVYVQVLVLERAGILDAFSRSARLMDGHKAKVIVLLIMLWVIGMLSGASYVVLPTGLGAACLAQVINTLLFAFGTIVATVVYFSARCQVEHLDLDLLADAVDTGSETGDPFS